MKRDGKPIPAEQVLRGAILEMTDIPKGLSGEKEDYHGLAYHLTERQLRQLGLKSSAFASYRTSYDLYFMVPRDKVADLQTKELNA